MRQTLSIEVDDKRVNELLERIDVAVKTIRECTSELSARGVLTLKENTASGN